MSYQQQELKESELKFYTGKMPERTQSFDDVLLPQQPTDTTSDATNDAQTCPDFSIDTVKTDQQRAAYERQMALLRKAIEKPIVQLDEDERTIESTSTQSDDELNQRRLTPTPTEIINQALEDVFHAIRGKETCATLTALLDRYQKIHNELGAQQNVKVGKLEKSQQHEREHSRARPKRPIKYRIRESNPELHAHISPTNIPGNRREQISSDPQLPPSGNASNSARANAPSRCHPQATLNERTIDHQQHFIGGNAQTFMPSSISGSKVLLRVQPIPTADIAYLRSCLSDGLAIKNVGVSAVEIGGAEKLNRRYMYALASEPREDLVIKQAGKALFIPLLLYNDVPNQTYRRIKDLLDTLVGGVMQIDAIQVEVFKFSFHEQDMSFEKRQLSWQQKPALIIGFHSLAPAGAPQQNDDHDSTSVVLMPINADVTFLFRRENTDLRGNAASTNPMKRRKINPHIMRKTLLDGTALALNRNFIMRNKVAIQEIKQSTENFPSIILTLHAKQQKRRQRKMPRTFRM